MHAWYSHHAAGYDPSLAPTPGLHTLSHLPRFYNLGRILGIVGEIVWGTISAKDSRFLPRLKHLGSILEILAPHDPPYSSRYYPGFKTSVDDSEPETVFFSPFFFEIHGTYAARRRWGAAGVFGVVEFGRHFSSCPARTRGTWSVVGLLGCWVVGLLDVFGFVGLWGRWSNRLIK